MSTSPQSDRLLLGLHQGIPVARYYADDLLDSPTLSRSELVRLVDQSPLHCRLSHPRVGGAPTDDRATAEMDFGALAHRLVLGRGADVVIVDAEDWRTKAAREARDDARKAGAIPALAAEVERARAVAQSFERELARFDLKATWDSGDSEVVCLWDEGAPVFCRCLIDRLCIDREKGRAIIFDPKFGTSAHPNGLGRYIHNQNLHVQEQFYTRAVEHAIPELAGRVEMMFLFMETEPPFQLIPATLNGEFRAIGISKVMRGLELWKNCLESDAWPGYTSEVLRVEPPGWALPQEMGAG